MFCSKCGAQLQDGAKFCPSCGAPAGATAPMQQPQQPQQTWQQPQQNWQQQQQPQQQWQQPQGMNLKEMLKGAKLEVGGPQVTFLGRQIPLKTGLIILAAVLVGLLILTKIAG